MNVLGIGSYFPTVGGAERNLHELCISLKQRRHKPTILCPKIKGFEEESEFKVFRVWTIISSNELIKKNALFEYLQNYSFIIPALFAGNKIMKKEKIDILQVEFGLAFGIIGVLLKKIRKKPLVITLQGGGLNFHGRRKFFRFLTKWVFKNADSIIAVSEGIAEEAKELTNKKIFIVKNSVFSDNFSNEGNEKYILAAGRLAKMKGFNFLLETISEFKELKNYKFVIVGDGPEKENLLNIVKERNLKNILFTGSLQHGEVKKMMSKCSLFVAPSLFGEGLPIVLIEAMASGKPLVGTSVRGIPEAISNNLNGYLIKAGSSKELSTAILKIMKSKKIRKSFGDESKKMSKKDFDWSKSIIKIEKIYKNLI